MAFLFWPYRRGRRKKTAGKAGIAEDELQKPGFDERATRAESLN